MTTTPPTAGRVDHIDPPGLARCRAFSRVVSVTGPTGTVLGRRDALVEIEGVAVVPLEAGG
jgi:hypothetical protein